MRTLIKCLILLTLLGCELGRINDSTIEPRYIDMACIELLTIESLMVRIDNEKDLLSFYDTVNTQTMDAMMSSWYDHYYKFVKQHHPEVPEELIESIFYSDYILQNQRLNALSQCQLNKDIDFESYTLLGISFRDSGCFTPELVPMIRIDDEKDVLTYNLIVEDAGICRADVPIHQYLLVRKLSPEYDVHFNITHL